MLERIDNLMKRLEVREKELVEVKEHMFAREENERKLALSEIESNNLMGNLKSRTKQAEDTKAELIAQLDKA